MRSLALRGIAILAGLLFALAGLEIALRIVYRDAGTTTCSGPGGGHIPYVRTARHLADPSREPSHPELERVVILGDSITWGVCVRDEGDVYPSLLLERLNRNGERFSMHVFAGSGREIRDHIAVLDRVRPLRPDILVYQWYANDMEADKSRRPRPRYPWRRFPAHSWLFTHSYAWRVLDLLLQTLPTGTPTYVQYLRERFAPGSGGWALFQLDFLSWAHDAASIAERVVVFLYPTLPYMPLGDRELPLSGIHRRIVELPGERTVRLPASVMQKIEGEEADLPGTTFGSARIAVEGKTRPGWIVFGPYARLPSGRYTVVFRLRTDRLVPEPVVAIDVAADRGRVLGRRVLHGADFPAANEWSELPIEIETGPDGLDDVELRVEYLGRATVAVDRIDVRYPPLAGPIELVDMTPHLRSMKTHASLFDAHPNEATHRVMADVLYDHLQRGPRGHGHRPDPVGPAGKGDG